MPFPSRRRIGSPTSSLHCGTCSRSTQKTWPSQYYSDLPFVMIVMSNLCLERADAIRRLEWEALSCNWPHGLGSPREKGAEWERSKARS